MKLLLDTNALLWLLAGDSRLSESALKNIEDDNEVVVSEITLWEISIKISIGKLGPIPELKTTINNLGFSRLNIRDAHLTTYESMPLLHRDPFDRMLVAQALVENATLVTSDTFLEEYGVKIISAT